MSAELDLYAALIADAGVTSRVPAERIYSYAAPADAPVPFIVYERSATETHSTIHDSAPVASKATVLVSSWSRVRNVSDAIADAVQLAMRLTGLPVNRFGTYQQEADLYGIVIEFDICSCDRHQRITPKGRTRGPFLLTAALPQ